VSRSRSNSVVTTISTALRLQRIGHVDADRILPDPEPDRVDRLGEGGGEAVGGACGFLGEEGGDIGEAGEAVSLCGHDGLLLSSESEETFSRARAPADGVKDRVSDRVRGDGGHDFLWRPPRSWEM
jgi:hypothetical protein